MHKTDTTYLSYRLKQLPKQGQSTEFDLSSFFKKMDQASEGVKATIQENVFVKINTSVQDLITNLTVLEQRNTSLQTSLRITIADAARLGQNIDRLSQSYGMASNLLRTYVGELNKVTKGNAEFLASTKEITETINGEEKTRYEAANNFNKLILEQYNRNRQLLGLSEQVSQNYTKFLAVQGGNAEATELFNNQLAETAKQLAVTTGEVGVYPRIIEQIANAGSTIQTAFAGSADQIARAALKADRMGVTLKDLVSISDKFLDIESSISNELELQLLGGKKINSEKFREAAVTQNLGDMADALSEIIDQQGDSIITNRFQREKLAETLGIEEDKLMDIYQSLQLNERITGKSMEGYDQALTKGVREAQKFSPADLSTSAQEAAEAADIRTTQQKAQEEANIKYTEAVTNLFKEQEKSITDLSNDLLKVNKDVNTNLTEFANKVANSANADALADFYAGVSVLKSTWDTIKSIFTGTNATKGSDASIAGQLPQVTEIDGGDGFWPAGTSNMIWSPTENSLFKTSPNDEIAVAPGIGNLAARGGSMDPSNQQVSQVPNVIVNIEGAGLDELISRITIRNGDTMNA